MFSVRIAARCGLALAPPHLPQEKVVRILRQRLLAHLAFAALSQRARGAWPSTRRHAQSQRCSQPPLGLMREFRRGLVQGRPGRPPALSVTACCSRDISGYKWAACTAPATAKIRECSFENAMSLATLLGGTGSLAWTGAGLTTSPTSLSSVHGLASDAFFASTRQDDVLAAMYRTGLRPIATKCSHELSVPRQQGPPLQPRQSDKARPLGEL